MIGRRIKHNELVVDLAAHIKESGYFPLGKECEVGCDESLLL